MKRILIAVFAMGLLLSQVSFAQKAKPKPKAKTTKKTSKAKKSYGKKMTRMKLKCVRITE